jgi:hypothetical protein
MIWLWNLFLFQTDKYLDLLLEIFCINIVINSLYLKWFFENEWPYICCTLWYPVITNKEKNARIWNIYLFFALLSSQEIDVWKAQIKLTFRLQSRCDFLKNMCDTVKETCILKWCSEIVEIIIIERLNVSRNKKTPDVWPRGLPIFSCSCIKKLIK